MGLKLKVNTGKLTEALSCVVGVKEKGLGHAVYTHCLIVGTLGGDLSISATTIDVSVSVDLEAEVKDHGSALLDTARLFKAVRALPGGEIKLEVADNHRATVCQGRIRSTLAGLSPEEFPDRPMSWVDAVEIQGCLLQEMLKSVCHAISTDAGRIETEGVYVHFEDRALHAAATDGHRLSIATARQAEDDGIDWERLDAAFRQGVLIPKNGVDLLLRTLDAGVVHVAAKPKQLVFHQDGLTIALVTPEKRFPNYRTYIGGERVPWFEASRAGLLAALGRCELFSGALKHVLLTTREGEVELHAHDMEETGEHLESLPCEQSSTEQSYKFNGVYLREALSSCSSEVVKFGTLGEGADVPVFILDGERSDRFHIVMPMIL